MIEFSLWTLAGAGFIVIVAAALLAGWEANRVARRQIAALVERLDRQRADITNLRLALTAERVQRNARSYVDRRED